jgi:hypothetical protein
MAKRLDKQEFHNMISSTMQLSYGISNVQENKQFNPRKRWPKNDTNVEDDPYETPTLAYNREMDQLMEEENVPEPYDEEESEGPKTTHLGNTMTYLNEKIEKPMTPRLKMDEEEKEMATPRLEMGLNDVNNT